jgi:hypothetical protein
MPFKAVRESIPGFLATQMQPVAAYQLTVAQTGRQVEDADSPRMLQLQPGDVLLASVQ